MSLTTRQYILKGAPWAATGRIVYAALGFSTSVLLARLLTRSDVGLYFLSISLSSFIAIFARAGMDNVLLRRISGSIGSGRPQEVVAATKCAMRVVTISTLLCVAGYLVVGPGLTPWLFPVSRLNMVTVPTALWIGALALQMTLTEVLRGFKDIRGAALTGGITNSALFVVLLLVVALAGGRSYLNATVVLWLSLAAAAVNIVLAAALVLTASRALPHEAVSTLSARKLLSEAWPLMLDSVVLFGLANIGLWVVGAMLSAEQVAIYGMALRLVTLVSMPTQIANSVLPPLMSQLYVQGRLRELENIVRKTTTLIALPMLLVLLPLVLYGGTILAALFGPAYREGGAV
ncbi:MAG: oligosaccharide flippase family protein, partial [Alphaproteobacteria bacterium]|nr:oligosaccharide flippase family protein [Alphaproteobacteria bacterium]